MPLTGTVENKRNEISVMWARSPMKKTIFFEMENRPDSFHALRVVIGARSLMRQTNILSHLCRAPAHFCIFARKKNAALYISAERKRIFIYLRRKKRCFRGGGEERVLCRLGGRSVL